MLWKGVNPATGPSTSMGWGTKVPLQQQWHIACKALMTWPLRKTERVQPLALKGNNLTRQHKSITMSTEVSAGVYQICAAPSNGTAWCNPSLTLYNTAVHV